MRVSEYSKRKGVSGSNDPDVAHMGEQVCKLKRGEAERFVMQGVKTAAEQSRWRSRIRDHVKKIGIRISVRWYQHIMVVERL